MHERLQCFRAKMLRQRFAIKQFPVLFRNVRNPLFADALRFDTNAAQPCH